MKVGVDAAARIAGGEADDAARKLSPWIYVGVCVLAALAFALFSLTGYVESKLAESGERQALALTQRSARYVGEQLLEAGPSRPSSPGLDGLLLFDARDGVIAAVSAESPLASAGSSVYDLVREAAYARTGEPAVSSAAEHARSRADAEASRMEAAVERGDCALSLGTVDGRKCYIAFVPTQVGSWYVCEVMPVDVVRSEVDVVSAIFAFVFLLSVLCVILAGAVAAYLYRKRAHEREVEMKTHLYAALSDSLDLSVFLFSPADGEVTAVVAEGASCGIGMSEDYLEHLFEPIDIDEVIATLAREISARKAGV